MATGGTIPTNREQSIIFYNTTGVIEKDKNMYFCPRFSQAGGTVKSKYLDKFNVVCPPSSVYTDIDVSSWSPQDRSLLIKGNVDDFRTVTDEGTCLNYFIITRKVTKNDNVYTYYYAFFITGVSQEGGSSIRLTVVPDDLTNVFYLHNNDTVTVGYEPFNPRLKNCYVRRQHYNRVNWINKNNNYTLSLSFTANYSGYVNVVKLEGTVKNVIFSNISHTETPHAGSGTVSDLMRYDSESGYIQIYVNVTGGVYVATSVISFTCDYTKLDFDNMKVFFNQEESYKYKYQYKDMKYPISSVNKGAFYSNYTKEELITIENEDSFSNLDVTLKKKIILSCIAYEVVELKSNEVVGYYYFRPNNQSSYSKMNRLGTNQKIDKYNKPSTVLISPFISVPDKFLKYKTSIDNFNLRLEYKTEGYGYHQSLYNLNSLIQTVNHNSIADYVYSAYLVSDVLMPPANIRVDHSNNIIYFRVNTDNVEEGCNLSALIQNLEDQSAGVYMTGYDRVIDSETGVTPCLSLSGINSKTISLKIEENIPDYKNAYNDPVLNAEPYSFYSLSLLSYELTFPKNRYYSGETSIIDLRYIPQYNSGLKFTLAPIYTVEGYEVIYYNEGLTATITELFPLVSDSYTTYYYQNMAQMKNQFAVENYNFGTDQLQNFFVTSPNRVGDRASKQGGAGALAQTGVEVMGWLDDWIDHNQRKHVIGMNQEAKLADMGRKPDSVKQAGSEVYTDLISKEYKIYFNHYTIDELSYNSIAKLYERIGYQVNLYSELNTMDRVGWNFIQLNAFDFNPEFEIMTEQESSIRALLSEGVTLLHDKSYLTSGHNYETILDE